jgi:hypothetical protein
MRFNSLTPSGKIHSVPICYAFDGTSLRAHARSKGTKRWWNIKKNETASVEIDSYSDDWSLLKGVLIDIEPSFVDTGPEQKRLCRSSGANTDSTRPCSTTRRLS